MYNTIKRTFLLRKCLLILLITKATSKPVAIIHISAIIINPILASVNLPTDSPIIKAAAIITSGRFILSHLYFTISKFLVNVYSNDIESLNLTFVSPLILI